MQSVLSRRFADSWQLISYTHVNLFLSSLCFLDAFLSHITRTFVFKTLLRTSHPQARMLFFFHRAFYSHHHSLFALSLSCAPFEGLAAALGRLNVSISQSLSIPRPTWRHKSLKKGQVWSCAEELGFPPPSREYRQILIITTEDEKSSEGSETQNTDSDKLNVMNYYAKWKISCFIWPCLW